MYYGRSKINLKCKNKKRITEHIKYISQNINKHITEHIKHISEHIEGHIYNIFLVRKLPAGSAGQLSGPPMTRSNSLIPS
jgi:hypothetical protein